MAHQSHGSVVGLHPQNALEAGRYLLDQDGRLHPLRFRRFIRAVAMVNVKPREVSDPVVGRTPVAARTAPAPTTRTAAAPHQKDHSGSGAAATCDEDPAEDPSAEFAAALDRVRSRKAGSVAKAAKPDYRRVADAHARRSQAPAKPTKKAKPLEPALSREECHACGIPGWKGCAHQLPYAGEIATWRRA